VAAASPPENLHTIIEREAVALTPEQRWRLEQAIAWRLHELFEPASSEQLAFVEDSPIPYGLVRR
jgi:hypothetical protein